MTIDEKHSAFNHPLLREKWEFSTSTAVRSLPIKWHIEAQEVWFFIPSGAYQIKIRLPLQPTGKEWKGRYYTVNSKEEAIGVEGERGAGITFISQNNLWDGIPSGYVAAIHWQIKKVS